MIKLHRDRLNTFPDHDLVTALDNYESGNLIRNAAAEACRREKNDSKAELAFSDAWESVPAIKKHLAGSWDFKTLPTLIDLPKNSATQICLCLSNWSNSRLEELAGDLLQLAVLHAQCLLKSDFVVSDIICKSIATKLSEADTLATSDINILENKAVASKLGEIRVVVEDCHEDVSELSGLLKD